MSNYRNALESYLKTIDVKAERVLDVGGAALPVKDRVKSWDVEAYIIADNGQEKGHFDIRMDLNKPTELIKDSFDVIFCLEVFEYIWNPVQAIQNLSKALHKGGTLYISFPFLYPIHSPRPYDYLRYTKSGAIRLLEENLFVADEITSRYMTGDGKMFWSNFIKADGMHAHKGMEHNELGWIIKAIKC